MKVVERRTLPVRTDHAAGLQRNVGIKGFRQDGTQRGWGSLRRFA